MIVLAVITASAWIWRRAIGTSKRLSPRSWRLLTCVGVALFTFSFWGLKHSTPPKRESYDGTVRSWVDDSASTFRAWSEINFVGSNELDEIDIAEDCAWLSPPYARRPSGRVGVGGPRPGVAGHLGNNGLHGFNIPLPDTLKNKGPHTITVKLESSHTQLADSKNLNYPTAPKYEGYLDFADCNYVYGWAADRNRLNTPINVGIYADNQLVQTVLANGSTTVRLSAVNLSSGSQRSYAWRTNTHSGLSEWFPLQTTVPTITAYSWNSFAIANQNLSGVIMGSGFVSGGAQVWFSISTTGTTPFNYSPIRWIERANSPIIVAIPAESDNGQKNLIFWMSVFGMIVSPISTILTLVLTWISLHRRRAEAILLRLEVEKQKLEIEKLRIEVERMRLESPIQSGGLLIVPG